MKELEKSLVAQLKIVCRNGFNDKLKATIMEIVRKKVDLGITVASERADPNNIASNHTLLTHFILDNKNGRHNAEIAELFTINKECAQINNSDGTTPLEALLNHFAYEGCSFNDFKLSALALAKNGADLSVCGELSKQITLMTYLIFYNASEANNKEIFELLKSRPELAQTIDTKFGSFLQQQIKSHPTTTVAAVQKWIELGSLVNTTNGIGETLLHTSCAAGNHELTEYFLTQKLALDARTEFNETLFHSSASCRNPKIWELLLKQKLSLNAQDKQKSTPLHSAVQAGNSAMVAWLVKHDANLELRDIEGNTPLSMAQKAQKFKKNDQTMDEIVIILSQVQHQKSNARLMKAIEEMHKYGGMLKKQDPTKGKIAINLARDLKKKVEDYSKNTKEVELTKFKEEMYALLMSKNADMSKYRINWATIVKNIAIALTGIGALALIGQLVYSKATQGRALFFFQKEKTTCEEQIATTEKALDFYC